MTNGLNIKLLNRFIDKILWAMREFLLTETDESLDETIRYLLDITINEFEQMEGDATW